MKSDYIQPDFKGQTFYIGLDVHKKSWTVCIQIQRVVAERFTMNPSPEELLGHLNKKYPGGRYKSVYEAGFCGFWIHRRLTELGIENIVVNPADIGTTQKEKDRKTDRVDAGKLSRELESGKLEPIYIPSESLEHIRSLWRLHYKIRCQAVAVKNRIKMHLHFLGIELPQHSMVKSWSGPFLKWIEALDIDFYENQYFFSCVEQIRFFKNQLKLLRKQIITQLSSKGREYEIIRLLCSVPGIGITSALTLYTEIADINRFPKLDNLASFVGLRPTVFSSGEKRIDGGLTKRRNAHLRHILIQAAWLSLHQDPSLLLSYSTLCKRMKKQEAIIRIARKLLNRIRYVWKNNELYVKGVVK